MSYKINSLLTSDNVIASYEKRLSICLLSNGFSFSVTTNNDVLVTFGEIECSTKVPMSELLGTIKNVFAKADIQPYGMKESELIVMSDRFVWVPQHLYDAANDRIYIETLYKIPSGMNQFSDYNESVKANIVFAADTTAVSAFKIAIPGLKIRCQHSKLANNTIMGYSDNSSVLAINIREGESDYAVFCNKKLQISNTFCCANNDETLYHALSIIKQFHLEDAAMTVIVCGAVDRNTYAKMRHFLPNLKLYDGRQLSFMNPEMQHLPLYRHALLFS